MKLRLVRDQGPLWSPIATIGEAPGKEEHLSGNPFCGVSGAELNRCLSLAGLRRPEVYVGNVVQRRPDKNNDISKVPKAELDWWREDLRRRLTLLTHVKIIVPVGNTALEAILGESRVKISKQRKLTISKARGFYFDDVTLDDGRKVLVIPVFHPAATFRDPTLVKVCEEIWKRIGDELRHGIVSKKNSLGSLLDDRFKIESSPHPDDALDFANDAIKDVSPISIDIETPRAVPRDRILCVGFTNDGVNGMTIPFADHRACGPKEWRVKYQRAVKMIVESDLEKVGQNFHFDSYMFAWLAKIHVKGFVWDTRTMHLTWDPRREHDLSSIASSMFRMRYWKDRDEDSRVNDDYGELADYCARDALVTWRAFAELQTRLGFDNLLGVYRNIYGRRFYPLLRIMLHGTAVDQPERDRRFVELQNECAGIRDQLTEIAEVSLAGEKSLSDKKIASFLYGPKHPPERPVKLTKTGKVAKNQPEPYPKGLELKPIIDKDTGRPTTNEVAIRKLRLRVEGKNQRATKALDLILDHRRKDQLSMFYRAERVDKDNRMRTSFGFAETGRLTSSSNPYGTGGNSQNVDRAARGVLLPDAKCIFVACDLSQAEDRIAKAYSKDPHLIELARKKSYEYDAHLDLASQIFEVDQKDVTKEQRYFGKRVRHAAQRGVRGQRFSDELLKDGVVRTRTWCDNVLDAYYKAEPGILNGYFPYVREQIMQYERLVTPWGFACSYRGERKDDALMREALSFLLQAGCVLTLDLQGLIPLDFLIQKEMLKSSRINNQAHDAVIVSCPLDEAFFVADFLVSNLERPVCYDGVDLSIPADVKIGASLADEDSVEWKRFPTREEFDKEAEKVFEIAEKKRYEAAKWKGK